MNFKSNLPPSSYFASQSKFADLLGVSVRTLQQWEQGRRQPTGAAQTLIKVAIHEPRALRKAVAA
jgi:putative transcriptional regulator